MNSNGTIIIEGLRVFSHIGVFPQEKTVGNIFEADISLEFDCGAVLTSGKLEDTLNYAEICRLARCEIEKDADLLEETAGRIQRALTTAFPQITGGHISLYKLHPPIECELRKAGFSFCW